METRTIGKNTIKNLWENLVRNYIMVFVVIVLFFILAMVSDAFLSETNLFNVLRQMSMVAILAVGSFFVLAGGGVDISVGSLVGLTSVVVAASLSNWNLSPFVAIILALLVGAVFGLINGLLIACIGVPPLIGTLGTMEIGRGLLYVFTNGYAIPIKITAISFIGKGYLWRIPWPVVFMVIIYLAGQFVSQKTKFGRFVYAIGGNEEASYLSGIRVVKIRLLTYVIGGLTAGISGVILASRMSSGQPNAGIGWEFEAITAALIGGVSILGGKGKVFGVFLGAVLLALLTNGMTLLDVSPYWQRVIRGTVLVGAIILDVFRSKRQNKV
jgi:ribose/xylose/arabinose/galactoside ABC-type transport system permease subunit